MCASFCNQCNENELFGYQNRENILKFCIRHVWKSLITMLCIHSNEGHCQQKMSCAFHNTMLLMGLLCAVVGLWWWYLKRIHDSLKMYKFYHLFIKKMTFKYNVLLSSKLLLVNIVCFLSAIFWYIIKMNGHSPLKISICGRCGVFCAINPFRRHGASSSSESANMANDPFPDFNLLFSVHLIEPHSAAPSGIPNVQIFALTMYVSLILKLLVPKSLENEFSLNL